MCKIPIGEDVCVLSGVVLAHMLAEMCVCMRPVATSVWGLQLLVPAERRCRVGGSLCMRACMHKFMHTYPHISRYMLAYECAPACTCACVRAFEYICKSGTQIYLQTLIEMQPISKFRIFH